MNELIHLRNEVSKTYDLGSGRRRCVISGGVVHYKNNYADPSEQWKVIDPTIVGSKVTTAPYELTIDGKKLTFKDKKTGEVSTLELLSAIPSGLPFEIKPFNGGVSFRHTFPSDKIPFQAQFRITGKARLRTRAFDDKGELELETSLIDGILTENLSQVKDKLTGLERAAVGNIRIDPTLTVQPSGKDTYLLKLDPDYNNGAATVISLEDIEGENGRRGILEFDISGLPLGAVLNSASLNLYYISYVGGWTNPSGKTVWSYKLIRTDWVELEATWNSYKTASNWTEPGGDYVTSSPAGGSTTFPGAANAWMTWNILAIVQDAHDSSIAAEFLVKFETEGLSSGYSRVNFGSNNYTPPDLQPKLVIDYTPPLENKSANMGSKMVAAGLI